jgi:hypothetical protein
MPGGPEGVQRWARGTRLPRAELERGAPNDGLAVPPPRWGNASRVRRREGDARMWRVCSSPGVAPGPCASAAHREGLRWPIIDRRVATDARTQRSDFARSMVYDRTARWSRMAGERGAGTPSDDVAAVHEDSLGVGHRVGCALSLLRAMRCVHIFAASTYRVRARIRRGIITERVPPHRNARESWPARRAASGGAPPIGPPPPSSPYAVFQHSVHRTLARDWPCDRATLVDHDKHPRRLRGTSRHRQLMDIERNGRQ